MCVAGVYTYEIAETKVATVEHMARAAEFSFFEYDGTGMKPVDHQRNWSPPYGWAFAKRRRAGTST